jgi:hypothetical protein
MEDIKNSGDEYSPEPMAARLLLDLPRLTARAEQEEVRTCCYVLL